MKEEHMKKKLITLALISLIIVIAGGIYISCNSTKEVPSKITFKSGDGIKVSADLYMPHSKEAPFIVLCHRAGWSRGEYIEIAPWLNELGYNCMAIDQRAGGKINMVNNETLMEAAMQGKDTGYPDAEQDIVAAAEYAKKKFAKNKLILMGSSYSSSLVLIIAANNPGLTDGVISFSPGEYFRDYGMPGDYVIGHAARLAVPVFISAASSELFGAQQLFDAVPGGNKQLFVPKNGGRHGAESLWKSNPLHEEYRKALKEFLAAQF